jgi:hypothetical protein
VKREMSEMREVYKDISHQGGSRLVIDIPPVIYRSNCIGSEIRIYEYRVMLIAL